jgi:hypothetical protein
MCRHLYEVRTAEWAACAMLAVIESSNLKRISS